MRAIVVTGSGRYADPWHPFAATGEAVADILRADGMTVDVTDDVDAGLSALDGVDLVVVAAGDPWRNPERAPVEVDGAAWRSALERGIGILALHAAASSLRDHPRWHEVLGGEWVEGTSWHPPLQRFTVHTDDGGTFTVEDESYTDLVLADGNDVVAWKERDGRRIPLAWTRVTGRTRVAYDALGHDARSYESEGHRDLVRRLARWALDAS